MDELLAIVEDVDFHSANQLVDQVGKRPAVISDLHPHHVASPLAIRWLHYALVAHVHIPVWEDQVWGVARVLARAFDEDIWWFDVAVPAWEDVLGWVVSKIDFCQADFLELTLGTGNGRDECL